VTGAGAVGRCALTNASACATDLQCGAGQYCLAGHCATKSGQGCATSTACPAGTVCLANKCQSAPCVDDGLCKNLFGANAGCVAKTTKWCANAPDVACTTRDECPACPTAAPCRRLCETRRLKMYEMGGNGDMTDLFLDPDERQVHENGPVAALLSDESGPYGTTLRQFACCIDDWWDGNLRGLSICGGETCPAALTCNQ